MKQPLVTTLTPHFVKFLFHYCTRFLTRTSFGEYFDRDKAKLFYKEIRCGILHHTEINGSSRICIHQEAPLVACSQDKRGLVIHRNKFYEQLVKEVQEYVPVLKDYETYIKREVPV